MTDGGSAQVPAEEHDRDARVEAFFADADNYLAGGGAYREARSRLLRSMLGPCEGLTIIDLGCGDGSLSLQFMPDAASVTLVDRSEEMLDAARRLTDPSWQGKVSYIAADLGELEVSGRYDLVLCIGVLAHVPDVDSALDLIASLVKPGGCCAIQLTDEERGLVPLFRRYARLRKRLGGAGRRHYSTNVMGLSEIRRGAEERGLSFEAERHYGLLIPGLDRFPAKLQRRIERASWQRPWLERHAIESILVFRAE